jgi:hypothetical protein
MTQLDDAVARQTGSKNWSFVCLQEQGISSAKAVEPHVLISSTSVWGAALLIHSHLSCT